MKNTVKILFCFLSVLAINNSFAGSFQAGTSQIKKDKTNYQPAKKGKKGNGVKNKIAVSDQAQPGTKANKTAKKDNGVINK